MGRRKGASLRVSLAAMTVTMNVLFLYASETLPGTRLIFCFLSALPVQVLLVEGYTGEAWLSYIATVLLGFVLCPDRFSWFFYLALLGHYGMMRNFFYRYVNVVWVRSLFLVLYCNLGSVLALWALYTVAGVTISSFTLPFSPLICIVFAEAAFFLLQAVYEGFLGIYLNKIRSKLLRSR